MICYIEYLLDRHLVNILVKIIINNKKTSNK